MFNTLQLTRQGVEERGLQFLTIEERNNTETIFLWSRIIYSRRTGVEERNTGVFQQRENTIDLLTNGFTSKGYRLVFDRITKVLKVKRSSPGQIPKRERGHATMPDLRAACYLCKRMWKLAVAEQARRKSERRPFASFRYLIVEQILFQWILTHGFQIGSFFFFYKN